MMYTPGILPTIFLCERVHPSLKHERVAGNVFLLKRVQISGVLYLHYERINSNRDNREV